MEKQKQKKSEEEVKEIPKELSTEKEKSLGKSETSQKEKKVEVKETPKTEKNQKIAIIRIRGEVGINKKIKDTLKMLRLYKKNWCVVLDKNPANLGMVKVVKDYATYGEINKELLDVLMKKAEKNPKGKIKPFRLNPPKGGFERKGIKVSFNNGGALGYRADKINALIKKML